MSGVAAVARSWRDAAALILASGAGAGRGAGHVLMQQRPAVGSFRNSVVFPGGVAERADSDPDWLQLLSSFGYSQADLSALHPAPAGTTAPLPLLLQPPHDPLLRQLSLRITAIRETFEELGVLVCSRQHKHQSTPGPHTHTATVITDFDIPYWQERVSGDPSALLPLCQLLGCYPAVWALHWRTSWLSPANLAKRFDTAFFLAHITDTPATYPSSEVAKAEWAPPHSVLSRPAPDQILYPPQAYELVLLSHRPHHRGRGLTPTNYHAVVRASDGLLYVLPGDALYPESVDYDALTAVSSQLSVAELRARARAAHRIECARGGGHTLVLKHYADMDSLIAPVHVTFS